MNNYKIWLFLLLFTIISGCKNFYQAAFYEISLQNLIDAHNQERAKHGKPEVYVNDQLMASAQKHANWMAEHNHMDHTGEHRSSPSDRVKADGYIYKSVGENIAYGQPSIEAVMNDWMHSMGHRANILGNYTEIGVGIATSKNGSIYWSADFGIPRY